MRKVTVIVNIRLPKSGCLGLNPALPSGKSLVLSEPHSSHLWKGDGNNVLTSLGRWRVRLEECVARG